MNNVYIYMYTSIDVHINIRIQSYTYIYIHAYIVYRVFVLPTHRIHGTGRHMYLHENHNKNQRIFM